MNNHPSHHPASRKINSLDVSPTISEYIKTKPARHQSSNREAILKAEMVVKQFPIGDEGYQAIRGVDTEIYAHDFTIIIGPSGSGKSTLLNLLTGLEVPTSGKIWCLNRRIDNIDEDERAEIRSKHFGIVYQQPIWIKSHTVLENVALPLILTGEPQAKADEAAMTALKKVGMEKYANHRPTEISGGQQQRVSLARALVNNPTILVLDEPTGNLDTHAADEVMAMMQDLQLTEKRSIIMVTHNLIYLPYASRTIEIRDGNVFKTTESEPTVVEAKGQA